MEKTHFLNTFSKRKTRRKLIFKQNFNMKNGIELMEEEEGRQKKRASEANDILTFLKCQKTDIKK